MLLLFLEAIYEIQQLNMWLSEQCWGNATAKEKTPGSWDLPFVGVLALK